MKLRDYQVKISAQGSQILQRLRIVYLNLEVRTGKSLIALQIAKLCGFKKVLFLTKKKAISSIESDYTNFGFEFELTVINYESLHKVVDNDYDLLICDEFHVSGAYPKPNIITKNIKKRFSCLPMIFLSGTMHPESYSQVYHQFWVSINSPFSEGSFYKWAKKYVNVTDKHLGYAVVKDYSDAKKELIEPKIKAYVITFSQQQAGFETEVKEHVLKVKMNHKTYTACQRLKKDKFMIAKDGREVMADTAVKLMQKLHQMYSGTVKFEDGSSVVFDTSKAEFIRNHFEGKRIGIFYKFKAEYEAIKLIFKNDVTNDLYWFNKGVQNIALQIVSGREGISLANADYLVYYNIDFSAVSYWQSRDRMTTKDRTKNEVFWIFSENGIENDIYRAVMNKRSYTVDVFKKDLKNDNLKLF